MHHVLDEDIVIVSAARTPVGHFRGILSEFDAVELYCPECQRSVPVSKRPLLDSPQGDECEYVCLICLTPLGTKIH